MVFPRFGPAVVIVLCVMSGEARSQVTYTWTQNSVGNQDWTASSNWDPNGVFSSGTSNTLQFFADTTTALVNGTNGLTTNVPSTLTIKTLTLNGLGAASTGPTNITIGTNASTWTLGNSPSVNLNGLVGAQGLNYTVAANLDLAANTSFTGNGTAGFAFSGVISGIGFNISKSGTNTLILTGSNTYSGTTSVTGGTLGSTNAVQAFGTNVSGISIGGTGTLSLRNDSSVSFTNGTSAYNINNSESGATINVDRVSGTGSNTITVGNLSTTSTAATWQLNFTGANGVSLNAGILTTPAVTAGAATIGNNISGGGTLTLSGVSGKATGANASLIFTGSGNTIVTGAISQAATAQSLTKSSTGTLILSGTNTYTGVTTISTNGGTLQFAKQVALYNNSPASWTASNIVVRNGGTFALNVGGTGEFTTGNVTTLLTNLGGLGGAVNNNGLRSGSSIGFDTTNAAGGTFTVANNIANSTGTGGGAIGLAKLGTGTLILTGTNTYDGVTNINAGTMLINGNNSSATGAVSVNNGGVMGGKGTIGGAITVHSGGTITAGPNLATPELNINAALTLANTATYQVKLFGTAAFDISLLTVNSANVTINTGSLIKLDLSALDSGQVSTLRSNGPVTYTVIQAFGGGSVGNFDQSNFSISNVGNFDNSEWMLLSNPTAGTVQLSFTPVPVPEPATVLGVAVAAMGVGGFVRRRFRKDVESTTAA